MTFNKYTAKPSERQLYILTTLEATAVLYYCKEGLNQRQISEKMFNTPKRQGSVCLLLQSAAKKLGMDFKKYSKKTDYIVVTKEDIT